MYLAAMASFRHAGTDTGSVKRFQPRRSSAARIAA
jgi:hypothetical protein